MEGPFGCCRVSTWLFIHDYYILRTELLRSYELVEPRLETASFQNPCDLLLLKLHYVKPRRVVFSICS